MELNLDNLEKAQALIQSMRSDLDNLERAVESKIQESKDETKNIFDCLAVTSVQVYPFKDHAGLGSVKALATVVLNDQFLVRGLRVMDGCNGLFVGYPLDPFFKGEEFRSQVVPMTRQLREHIENCVLEKYQQVIGD